MKFPEIFLSLCGIHILSLSPWSSGAPLIDKQYKNHIMLPILQQQALRYYQQNYANRQMAPAKTKTETTAIATSAPGQKKESQSQSLVSPRQKLNWSKPPISSNTPSPPPPAPPKDSRTRIGSSRKIKRDGDGSGDAGGPEEAKSLADGSSKIQGRSMMADPNEGFDGILPNGGPYSEERLVSEQNNPEQSGEVEDPLPQKQSTFKNWEEYKETKSVLNMRNFNLCKDCGPMRYTPVIDPDKHFRDVDKLFRRKNERVKTFFDLNRFMKKQGKIFEFPTKSPIDRKQSQPTA